MWHRIWMVVVWAIAASVQAGELALQGALQLAEQHATELQTLEAEQSLAAAAHTRSAQAFMPTISADAALLRADGSLLDGVPVQSLGLPTRITYLDIGPIEGSTRGIQLIQPVFHADALKGREQAAHGVEARRLSYQWGHQRIRLQVVARYYAVAVRQANEKAARMALEAARQALALAEAAFQEGLVAKVDVVRARADAQASMARVDVATAAVQEAQVAVKTLLGLSPQDAVLLVSPLPEPISPGEQAATARQRHDLLAWKAEHAAATAGLEKAQAGWLPKANLLARQQWVDADDPFDVHGWLVAVQLEWTLFDGMDRQGKIAEARAREELVRIQVEQSRRLVAQQQELAIKDWQAAWSAWQASDQAVQADAEALMLARRQYEEGVGSMTDLLATQASLYQRRLAYNRYQYNVLTASMNYYLYHGLDPLMALSERGR